MTTSGATRTPAVKKVGYRPEIQGIRAVAALLVATFHLWLGRVSGGVDVFFVMSGFLVTTTLFGHYARFGRVRPLYYLGRLGRRLLPAALTVLAVVAVVSWFVLPKLNWARTAKEIVASMFYVENWSLALDSVDYLAQFETKTPVQHFWAMSVQGQFYLIWMIVFLVIGLIAAITPALRRRAVLITFVVLAIVSFAWSVFSVGVNQPFAYFDTTARVWEFALGGISAIVIGRVTLSARLRGVLSWIGLIGIISCGIALQVSTLFPGVAALWPTLAALAILFSGGAESARWSAVRLLSTKPFVWLGDISYGLYLWHWPMLVVFLSITGSGAVGLRGGLAILVGAIILAWLTNRFIEKPFARDVPAGSPRRWLRPAVATLVVVGIVAGTTAGTVRLDSQIEAKLDVANALQQNIPTGDPCFGAEALLSGADNCDYDDVVPDPITRGQLENEPCVAAPEPDFPAIAPCAFGATDAAADATTVLLVGDSHSMSIRAAVNSALVERGWRGIAISASGCIASTATRDYATAGAAETCTAWNDDLLRWIEQSSDIDVMISMASAGRAVQTADGENWQDTAMAGYRDEWAQIAESIPEIVVIRDTPRLAASSPACVERSLTFGSDPAENCAIDRTTALRFDPAAEAAASDDSITTEVVDLTDGICDADECYPVVGGLWAYTDNVHLTRLFSSSLGPFLGSQLDEVLSSR